MEQTAANSRKNKECRCFMHCIYMPFEKTHFSICKFSWAKTIKINIIQIHSRWIDHPRLSASHRSDSHVHYFIPIFTGQNLKNSQQSYTKRIEIGRRGSVLEIKLPYFFQKILYFTLCIWTKFWLRLAKLTYHLEKNTKQKKKKRNLFIIKWCI